MNNVETLYERLRPYLSRPFSQSLSCVSDSGDLTAFYQRHNGGYYWAGALLIRPCSRDGDGEGRLPLTIGEWNERELWKELYEHACDDVAFFAEDTFGTQFGIQRERIVSFDPETAAIEHCADHLDAWVSLLIADADYVTGLPVLRDWQRRNGELPIAHRLVPKQPFMLGGTFRPDNMVSKRDVEGMRLRAQLWKQTKDIADGQKITFRLVE